jgi:hypothetical protein
MREKERQRQRETETRRDRDTERQRHGETERQKDPKNFSMILSITSFFSFPAIVVSERESNVS